MRQQYPSLTLQLMLSLLIYPWHAVSFADSADPLYQRSLAATCASCHGTDGKGVVDGGIPLINHLTITQILQQLNAYQSGTRTGTIMPQLTKGYTAEQLATIAAQLGKNSR